MSRRSTPILAAFCAVLAALAAAAPAAAGDGAWKAAHDTDPHVPLTPYQQQMLAQKQQAVVDNLGAGAMTPGAARTTLAASAPVSASLLANQMPHQ